MNKLLRLLRNVLRREQMDQDVTEELEAYLNLVADQKIAAGMTEQEARRAARLEIGSLDQVKASVRDVRVGAGLQQACQDMQYGARALRRSPGFALFAIVLLSLAIGVNTAMFSIIEGVLLRPLPYKDSERVYVLWKSVPHRNIDWDWTSAPTIRDWREQGHAFEDMALVLRPEGSQVIFSGKDGPLKLQGSIVSGNFFDVLGTPPLLGRTFSSDESHRGDQVVVLSHRFWQHQFGGDKRALGRAMRIDDRSVTIIGVMPPGFELPDSKAQLWLLLSADPRWTRFQMARFRIADAFCALARLKPGVSIEQARAEMRTVATRLAQDHPETDRGLGIRVMPLFEHVAGPRVRTALWTLGAAVLGVLLIACSNLASLMVARSVGRRRELAVRVALGAGRARLVSQLTAESVLLALVGGLGGIILALAGLPVLLNLAPADLPRSAGIDINGVVLAFSFGLCLLSVLASGLGPAWRISGAEAREGLHDRGRGLSAGPRAQRVRGALVAVQYALAIMLLSGAGLFVRSFLLLNSVERGFDTTNLLTVSVPLPYEKYKERARGEVFFDEALQRVAALPGVSAVATGEAVFNAFRGNAPNQHILVEGKPFGNDPTLHARNIVSDEYFRTLGIPLREGRLFSIQDGEHAPAVAIINETMARHFWPSESAVGKRFQQVLPGTQGDWMTIVGVVPDVIYNRDGLVIPVFYRPARQWYFTERELVIRTDVDARTLVAAVRQAVQSVDPTLPQVEVATVEDRLAEQDRSRQFQRDLLAIFAGLAVFLAAMGLYGLMAYAVEQRIKEIGIRMALGSTSTRIARLVLKDGARWGGVGLAIGLVGAIFIGRALAASLYGITPTDPWTLVSVTAILGAVMGLASLIPALRASKVDPTVALRQD